MPGKTREPPVAGMLASMQQKEEGKAVALLQALTTKTDCWFLARIYV